MTAFTPASINSRTLLTSAFGKTEKELAAMCVTAYLASLEAEWTTEFTWYKLAQWVENNAQRSLNELYLSVLRMMGVQKLINGLYDLVNEQYVMQRDTDAGGDTFFTVTDRFVEAMQPYDSVSSGQAQ